MAYIINKKIIFFFRAYNDIDHMTPIIFRLKKDNPKIIIKCIIVDLNNNYIEDYRIKYLIKKSIEVDHIVDYFHYPIIFQRFYKWILNLRSSSHINDVVKIPVNLTIKLLNNTLNAKLQKIPVPKFVQTVLDDSFGIFVFDQTFNPFYEKLCQYLNDNGIISVAVPHGHNIFGNMLISIKSLSIEPKKGIQNHSIPYKYVIFENNTIANRFLEIGYVTSEQIKILGSSRFCLEWNHKIREILPPDNLPILHKDKLKIVLMLSKPLYNVFVEEIHRTVKYICSFPNVYVIVKPHTRGESFNDLLLPKNVLIVNNDVHSPSLIDWADVVLFTNSSIIFESLKLGKPTLYMKTTHANKLLFENYFKSWQIECRDDLRDFIWKFINDRKTITYSNKERDQYCKDCIEPVGPDALEYYSNFIRSLFK